MEHDPTPPPVDPREAHHPGPGHDRAPGHGREHGRDPTRDQGAAAALARRLDRPLVLVGMMGVGKSSVGRKLAAALGWPFVDADDAIETAAQMTIPEIFATYGEAAFRDGERRVIARLLAQPGADPASPGPARVNSGPARANYDPPRANSGPARANSGLKVIATGGGAFVHPETRALILGSAIAIWLDAELDTLIERTARKDNRPLLRGGDPRDILGRLREERAQHYAAAPIRVMSGNAPQARTLANVIAAVHAHLGEPGDATPPMAQPNAQPHRDPP